MLRSVSKSLWLLFFAVVLVCGIYPAILWSVGQTLWPFQVNGSIIDGPDGKPVGSLLVAQPFTKDEYFQPRPSAASYDATASASSGLGVSNYTLRDRAARAIGPVAVYNGGPKRVSRRGRMSRPGFKPINSAVKPVSLPNGRMRIIRSPRAG
jgi:K+-transporting ATPase ATPase C chain